MTLILVVASLLAQTYRINEGFNGGTTPPTGWTMTGLGTYTSAGNFGASSPSLAFNDTGDLLQTTTFATGATKLSFWVKSQNASGSSLLIQAYYNSQWNQVVNITSFPGTGTVTEYDLNTNATQLKFVYTKSNGNISFDDLKVWVPAAGASISVNPSTLTGFSYVYGNGPSTHKTFTLTGSNLGTNSITVSSTSTDYVICDTQSGTYGTSLSYPPASGSVSATVYVMLKSGLDIGDYNGQNIACSSSGATTQNVTCSGTVTDLPPTASILLRPSQIDISSATSESAILVQVQKYGSNSAKYRLFATGQYYCWDPATSAYISSSTYANGPLIPGTPSTSSTWWIPFQAGSNLTTSASYRDRLDPYSSNYQTAALPSATAISVPASITKNQVTFNTWNSYSAKYVILGYDSTTGGTLISATSSALTSGSFNLVVESGTTIRRIEIRDLLNNLIESVTGTWPIVTVATPVISPVSGTYYTNQTVSISCATDGSTIYYTTNGNDPTTSSTPYSGQFQVTQTTTVKAIAVKVGMADSAIATVNYVLPIPVANIAALRAGTPGTTLYKLTGEALLTFQHAVNNSKWIEDATGAIMIYDPSAKITSSYSIGDKIQNIIGTLTSYHSLLEFVPVTDPGAAVSSGNPVVPTERTLSSLTSDDQSKLIKVVGVTLDSSSGNFLTTAQSINATQGSTTLTLRTFANTDYSSTAIPTTKQNITCLVGQYDTGMQISPRFLADFETSYDYPAGVPVSVGGVTITVTGGSANNGTGSMPSIPNTSGTYSNYLFALDNSITNWTITMLTNANYGAYYQNGSWHVVSGSGTQVVFNIVLSGGKAEVEIPVILGDQDPTLPVELSSFTATMTAQNLVSVMWVTQTETNVNGYYVYRGSSSELNAAAAVSSLIGAYNTSQQQVYQFTDTEVFEPGTYYYWLQVQDLDGSIQFHGPTTVYFDNEGNNGTPVIPKVTELKSIYPNPFNPSTTIYYSLAKAETVDFVIYNNRGQIVRSFNEGNKGIGNHSLRWNGEDQYGRSCSTGIYYIKMTAGKDSFIRKAVLMK